MSGRILVVDDSATIQKVIKIAFSRHAATVATAGSIAEALADVAANRPRVMIVDAGMSGDRAAQELKRLSDAASGTPMLLLVGSYDDVDENALRAAGFEHFLRKPFDPGDIIASVNSVLGESLPETGAVPGRGRSQNQEPETNPRDEFIDFAESTSTSSSRLDAFAPPPMGTGNAGPAQDPGHRRQSWLPVENDSPSEVPSPNHFVPPPPLGQHSQSSLTFSLEDLQSDPGDRITEPAADLPPIPMNESFKRGQRAFTAASDQWEGADEEGPQAGPFTREPDVFKAPPPPPIIQQPSRGEPLSERPVSAGTHEKTKPGRSVSPETAELKREELEILVRTAVEDYCKKYFPQLARDVITTELRRLADERARLLIDT